MPQEVIIDSFKDLIKDESELYNQYLKLEEDYYNALGDDYVEFKLDINIEPSQMKEALMVGLNNGMCLDELLAKLLLSISNNPKEEAILDLPSNTSIKFEIKR